MTSAKRLPFTGIVQYFADSGTVRVTLLITAIEQETLRNTGETVYI